MSDEYYKPRWCSTLNTLCNGERGTASCGKCADAPEAAWQDGRYCAPDGWLTAKVTGLDRLGLGFVEATGQQFAFTFDQIDGYRGQHAREIGLKIGAIVGVQVTGGKVNRISLSGVPVDRRSPSTKAKDKMKT